MSYINSMPDDNNANLHLFILDPLSVIIKLAIISNKPIGTKLRIDNNVIYLQEPGLFQGLSRYFYKSNKTNIQYQVYRPTKGLLEWQEKEQDNFDIKTKKKDGNLFLFFLNSRLSRTQTNKKCSFWHSFPR